MGVLDKKIGPPPAALAVSGPRLAVFCGNHRQHAPAAIPGSIAEHFPRNVAGYALDVFHYFIGFFENLFVNPLVGIAHPRSRLVPHRAVGIVDMARTE